MTSITSLAVAANACEQTFTELVRHAEKPLNETCATISCEDIEDESGRFKIWAGNLGAFQPLSIHSSLEYRLRESPKMTAQILELLLDLLDILQSLCAIESGARENRQFDEATSEEDEDFLDKVESISNGSHFEATHQHLSEATELFHSVQDTLTSLFRLSIVIRKASPRDRFTKALASRNNPFNEQFDISHVGHKFPLLDEKNNQWLKERLGRAITQRRHFLRYAREHRKKLGQEKHITNGTENSYNLFQQPIMDWRLAASGSQATFVGIAQSTKPTSTSAPTNASTFLTADFSTPDNDIQDDRSQTSYAISLGYENDDNRLSLPALQEVSKGKYPFECPLCFSIQDIKTENSWRKHAFSDLRPYVCTFGKCDIKLFSDRAEWFAHEHQCHRRQWCCHFCKRECFYSRIGFREHLVIQHSGEFTEGQLDAICEASERPLDRILATDCPFCLEWEAKLREENSQISNNERVVVTPLQFRHHVGSHMQQLALFAIPRGYLEEEKSEFNSEASVAAAGNDLHDTLYSLSSKVASWKSTNSIYSELSFNNPQDTNLLNLPEDISDSSDTIKVFMNTLMNSNSNTGPLKYILPLMSHAETLDLRARYKEFNKIHGKGINIAKQIRSQFHGSFGKACYVTALGQWESEVYWITHQLRNTSIYPELLIEALIGRTNRELLEISTAFRNSNTRRNINSLAEYIQLEVEPYELRKPINISIQDQRKAPDDLNSIEEDIDLLHEALNIEEGSEDIILSIFLTRPEQHLKNVLQQYEQRYKSSLPEALRDLPHILSAVVIHAMNGIINKPLRDALIIHQALFNYDTSLQSSNSSLEQYTSKDELLISRLVRLHWDHEHLRLVRATYKDQYGESLDRTISKNLLGDFREFCLSLIRNPDLPKLLSATALEKVSTLPESEDSMHESTSPTPDNTKSLESWIQARKQDLTPPIIHRALRFRILLIKLSTTPLKWDNSRLDDVLQLMPLGKIYEDAETKFTSIRIMNAELATEDERVDWDYNDCVIQTVLQWFNDSFFTWLKSSICSQCSGPIIFERIEDSTMKEGSQGSRTVEVYKCRSCAAYETFVRHTDPFIILEKREGRNVEGVNCFGLICRALGARVRWVWSAEDHVWLEVFSKGRNRWIHIDPPGGMFDMPLKYTNDWGVKLRYCFGFSADGAQDVMPRYVRNPKSCLPRDRASETDVRHIIEEIKTLRRYNINKDDRALLEREDTLEEEELISYISDAVNAS